MPDVNDGSAYIGWVQREGVKSTRAGVSLKGLTVNLSSVTTEVPGWNQEREALERLRAKLVEAVNDVEALMWYYPPRAPDAT